MSIKYSFGVKKNLNTPYCGVIVGILTVPLKITKIRYRHLNLFTISVIEKTICDDPLEFRSAVYRHAFKTVVRYTRRLVDILFYEFVFEILCNRIAFVWFTRPVAESVCSRRHTCLVFYRCARVVDYIQIKWIIIKKKSWYCYKSFNGATRDIINGFQRYSFLQKLITHRYAINTVPWYFE